MLKLVEGLQMKDLQTRMMYERYKWKIHMSAISAYNAHKIFKLVLC